MAQYSRLKITSIKCNSPSENGVFKEFNDEVYLLCQADGGVPIRYPMCLTDSHSMTTGNTWVIDNLILNFEYEILITLWDVDVTLDPQVGTYLVSHEYCYNGDNMKEGNHSVTPGKNPNGASYTINSTALSPIQG